VLVDRNVEDLIIQHRSLYVRDDFQMIQEQDLRYDLDQDQNSRLKPLNDRIIVRI